MRAFAFQAPLSAVPLRRKKQKHEREFYRYRHSAKNLQLGQTVTAELKSPTGVFPKERAAPPFEEHQCSQNVGKGRYTRGKTFGCPIDFALCQHHDDSRRRKNSSGLTRTPITVGYLSSFILTIPRPDVSFAHPAESAFMSPE